MALFASRAVVNGAFGLQNVGETDDALGDLEGVVVGQSVRVDVP